MQSQACVALLAGLAALCSGVARYREPLHPAKLHPAHKPFGHPYKSPAYPFHHHKHPGAQFVHPHKIPANSHKPSFHYRRPAPPHPPRNAIRPPARPQPHIAKPSAPPPFQPGPWATQAQSQSHFQPPAVRETFLSAAQFNGVHTQDEDKGPIHTIPAPNLSPNDRPSQNQQQYQQQQQNQQQNHQQQQKYQQQHTERTQPDHRVSGYSGYQVSEEDPSAHKPDSPSYFAPDPDPSLPTVGLPPITDPHSTPSNGQPPPPDLHLHQLDTNQQQPQQQQQNYASPDGPGNALSPQDLYKLLHQQDGGQMTVDLYQQYLQAAAAAQQPYQQQLVLYPQQYQQQVSQNTQQNFHPQFENFNYNEQTQEGSYGSDSFPSASINVGVKRTISKDTKVSGESSNSIPADFKGHSYAGRDKDSDDVFSNQVEYEDGESTEDYEGETSAPNLITTGYYASLPNKEAAETLATLAVAGNINNQIMKNPVNDQQNQVDTASETKAPLRIQVEQQEANQKEEDRNQQYRTQERKEEPQSFQSHHMGGHKENMGKPKLPFINHEMRVQQTTQTGSQNQGETSETEYSEEEILDPSDKDLRNNNLMLQKGMMMYQNIYRSKNENEQTREPAEEQSYEDSDGDYTQEEEKEIEKNTETKTTEKSAQFNAHQNRLPFGAKLRPKRV